MATNDPLKIEPQTYNLMNEKVTANPVTGAVISVENLKPTPPIDLLIPNSGTNGADTLMSGVNAGTKDLNDYIAASTASSENTPYGNKVNDLFSRLQSIIPDLAGKNQYQADAEAVAGVPTYSQDLQNANSATIVANAEYEAIKAEREAKKANLEANKNPSAVGMTTTELFGQQGAVDKAYNTKLSLKATEAALSYAKAQAAAGNLTVAQGIANRAVDLKYADKIQEKQDILDQLQAISPFLTAEQSKIKDAVTQKTNDDKIKLEEEKAKSKDIISTALAVGITTRFYNYAGEIRDTLNGTAYISEADFKTKTGMTLQNAQASGMITDYNTALIKQKKTTPDIPEGYPSTSQVQDWILKNKQSNPGMDYYDLWGQLAQNLQKRGINPTDFDKQFWQVLHPEGLAGYEKYNQKAPASSGGINFDDL